MRALLGIFRMRFGILLNYRMAALAGIATQIFFGLVMVMVYHAFYGGGATGLPMTLAETTTYVWLGQAFLGLIPWNGDREIQAMIRSGDFAYEMVRPLDVYWHWSARMLAGRIAPTMLKATPLILLVSFFGQGTYGLMGPVNMTGFWAFAVALISGICLGIALTNLITISVLFTIGDGVDRLIPAFVMVFGGLVVPLAMFPDSIQWIIRLLPFSGVVDAPYRFYLGLYKLTELPLVLLHQWLWTLLLIGVGRFLMQKASRRVIVQGG